MKISLVAPSIRPELWEQFTNSLTNNTVDFEIIFVGPKAPLSKLPRNVRWIDTNVKPSQCTHIGFMEAKGEYISLTADDAQYFSPNKKGALDNMMEFIGSFPTSPHYTNKNLFYGFRMFEDSFCIETSTTHYLVNKEESKLNFSPLLYPFFIMKKDLYIDIGGYDNRFICGQAENDLLLRIASQYGHTDSTLCPTAMVWANHDSGHNNKGKFREYHSIENKILKDLWLIYSHDAPKGKFINERLDKNIMKYTEENLYTISQGNKGEWQ